MKFRQYFLFVIFLLSYLPILAQVDTAWVRHYDGPGNASDVAYSVAADDSGNVYVTGYSAGSGTSDDFATIKYSPDGDTLWVRRYNGPGNGRDWPIDLAVNVSGNVFVTGYTGSFPNSDYATIKYAPNGDTLWVRTYNGPGNSNDNAQDLVVDDSGNIYITGHSWGGTSAYDYATIKYATNGDTLWIKTYNGPLNGTDEARDLAVDNSGNVYVTGRSEGIGSSFDYATIKYTTNGDTVWVRRYNGFENGNDHASHLVVDGSGNVYVAGFSGIFPNLDYATIKYAPGGETLWVRRYNGPLNGTDDARALVVDTSGNVYVTGQSEGLGSTYDFATVKYAPDGESLWVRRYNGAGNGVDYAYGLMLDSSGNVYVTGFTTGSGTGTDFTTIKYAPNGDTLWVRHYSSPGNSGDAPFDLALDNSGNVYVTGYDGVFPNYNYVTIKYAQCLAKPGDVTGDGNVLLPDIVAIINFLFRGQPAPSPLCRGDANGNGNVLLPDIVYLINFIFRSGLAPVKSQACCL